MLRWAKLASVLSKNFVWKKILNNTKSASVCVCISVLHGKVFTFLKHGFSIYGKYGTFPMFWGARNAVLEWGLPWAVVSIVAAGVDTKSHSQQKLKVAARRSVSSALSKKWARLKFSTGCLLSVYSNITPILLSIHSPLRVCVCVSMPFNFCSRISCTCILLSHRFLYNVMCG